MESRPVQLRISTPAEAAQIVPYLVGFTPTESLVVCAVQRGRVMVTARADLADVRRDGRLEDVLDRIWARFPDADASAFVYTADHQTGWNLLARCDNHLPYGCQGMLIDGDAWRTPDGSSGTVDPYGTIAAQATYHGLPHLRDRAELEARFTSAPDSDQLVRHLAAAVAALPPPTDTAGILAQACELIDRHLPGPTASPEMTARDAVQLGVLAQHPGVRDLALLAISRDNASEHLMLWQTVVQRSPAYGSDMPLYLAGMAAWISGDGASATIAVERSLTAEPQPTGPHPARLLEGLIDNVIPPSAWDRLRHDIADHAYPEVKTALHGPVGVDGRPGWPPATTGRRSAQRPETRRRPPGPGIAI